MAPLLCAEISEIQVSQDGQQHRYDNKTYQATCNFLNYHHANDDGHKHKDKIR